MPGTVRSCHILHLFLISWLDCTVTGFTWGPLSLTAGRAELSEFPVPFTMLFSKLTNELQLQMVYFVLSCQQASHTARSRNLWVLQNNFLIFKICSNSGFHYGLASPHPYPACNINQIPSSQSAEATCISLLACRSRNWGGFWMKRVETLNPPLRWFPATPSCATFILLWVTFFMEWSVTAWMERSALESFEC